MGISKGREPWSTPYSDGSSSKRVLIRCPSDFAHHEKGDAEVEKITGDDGEEDGAGDGEGLQEEVRHEHASQNLRRELGLMILNFIPLIKSIR